MILVALAMCSEDLLVVLAVSERYSESLSTSTDEISTSLIITSKELINSLNDVAILPISSLLSILMRVVKSPLLTIEKCLFKILIAEINVILPMKKDMKPTKSPADTHSKENGIEYSAFLYVVKKLAKGGNIKPIIIPVPKDKNKYLLIILFDFKIKPRSSFELNDLCRC